MIRTNTIKKVMLVLIFSVIALCISTKVQAAVNGCDMFNNAPRMKFNMDKNPDTSIEQDIEIILTDNNGISSVEFYEANSNNGKPEKGAQLKEGTHYSLKSDGGTTRTYTISWENYLKSTVKVNSYENNSVETDFKYIYVKIKDASGNYTNTHFRIVPKNVNAGSIPIKETDENGKEITTGFNNYINGFFKTDLAPRIYDYEVSGGMLKAYIKDNEGVAYVKFYDENAKNPKVTVRQFKQDELKMNEDKTILLEVPLSEFTTDSAGNYCIKIGTRDAKSKNDDGTIKAISQATRRISFKVNGSSGVSSSSGSSGSSSGASGSSSSGLSGGSSSTATAPGGKEAVKIELDKTVVMIDDHHYDVTYITPTVDPANAKLACTSSNEKVATAKVGTVDGVTKVKVNAVNSDDKDEGYGTTTIKVTATMNGYTATAECEIRVIKPMYLETSDCKASLPYVKNTGDQPKDYYIKNYPDIKTTYIPDKGVEGAKNEYQTWSNEEVASYINNMAELQKYYAEKNIHTSYTEVEEQTFYTYGLYEGTTFKLVKGTGTLSPVYTPTSYSSWIKPKGELVAKNAKHVLLFTTKNQCLYLLKLNDENKWEVEKSILSACGYYWGKSGKVNDSNYSKAVATGIKISTNSNSGLSFLLKTAAKATDGPEKNVAGTNSLHLGSEVGYPCSHGCIHLGSDSGDNSMYKAIYNIMKSGEPLKLIYY